MRVEIYWNLHRKLYSVRALEGPQKGRVIGHAREVLLDSVTFKVREGGRQRVIREQRKNVHAFVRGEIVGARWTDGEDREGIDRWTPKETNDGDWLTEHGEFITYNPYRFASFQAADFSGPETRHRPITGASRAFLTRTLLIGARRAVMYAEQAA
jgi:hypothetical protein